MTTTMRTSLTLAKSSKTSYRPSEFVSPTPTHAPPKIITEEGGGWDERGGGRERQADRQTETDRERQREREREST